MRYIQFFTLLFAIIIFTTGCKIEYRPPVASPKTGYLVVEGFINSDGGPTTITLSRTLKIYNDSTRDNREHNAIVNIEGSNNETFPLYETGDGVYTSSPLQLNSSEKYRLKIKTQYGKEYESDYSTYRATPDIDSLSWKRDNNGVKIYINTHDDQNNPGYYYWKYEETWEFHSRYISSLKWVYNSHHIPVAVAYTYPDQRIDTSIYRCWKTVNSSNINVGSSEKLNRNLIYYQIMSIEPASEKLSVLYSLNVRQYAVSKEGYAYLQKLKRNTEEIGSIFAAQPSELTGNIHCTTDPSEIAIGYVEVSQEKDKRLYINNSELPGWNYHMACATIIVANDAGEIQKNGAGLPTIPYAADQFGIHSFYDSYDPNCVDCTLRGSNVKPVFWP
ncbi:MAG: DUF4249 domain-containing protein [Bacteroidota bacterium]|nr:DUF4249 domain-containing protein [Bacteroidota bacterium]